MNVYVIEDSVKGTGSGWDQVNYYNTQSGHTYYGAGNPIVGFNHMHVVRAMLGGPFGTPGFITKDAAINKTFSKYYTYTLPSGANYKHFKLVAMVEKDNPTDPNDRAFNNSIEAKLTPGAATFKTTDVKTLSAISGMEVYPNPAASSIRLTGTFESTSSVQVSLINTIGQTVVSRTLAGVNGTRCDEAIDVSSLSNGIYMLQVRSEEGQSTTQVVVQH
jgi:hypothetical protein